MHVLTKDCSPPQTLSLGNSGHSAEGSLVVPLNKAVSYLADLNKGCPVIEHLLACVLVTSNGEV